IRLFPSGTTPMTSNSRLSKSAIACRMSQWSSATNTLSLLPKAVVLPRNHASDLRSEWLHLSFLFSSNRSICRTRARDVPRSCVRSFGVADLESVVRAGCPVKPGLLSCDIREPPMRQPREHAFSRNLRAPRHGTPTLLVPVDKTKGKDGVVTVL